MQIRPTHIAIDGNEANVVNRVGSNVYAFEIISELEKCCRIDPAISVTVLLSAQPLPDLPQPRAGWRYQVVTPQKFWTQWALPLHLFRKSRLYSVFFTPGHYAPRLSLVPYITSVMDTAYLDVPFQFKPQDVTQLKHWTAYSVKNAQKVVAISEATKNSICKWYGKSPEDVIVAYPSVEPLEAKMTGVALEQFYKDRLIQSEYFLYVGSIQPRKNIGSLVSAFEIFCKRLELEVVPDVRSARKSERQSTLPQLVIAGKVGWLAEPVLEQIKRSPYAERIILTGFVTELEKKTLMEHALSLVLLGEYEGFGIPPLEAMVYGTIPLVSNSSSLPEVVGEAGITVDPHAIDSISEHLWQLYHMKAKQRGMFKRTAREQRKLFSWRRSALVILQALIAVAHPEVESILEAEV